MNDIFFKTLVMHLGQGLLAAQSGEFKFIDTPGKKKEEHFADQTFAFANEIMKRFKKLDESNASNS